MADPQRLSAKEASSRSQLSDRASSASASRGGSSGKTGDDSISPHSSDDENVEKAKSVQGPDLRELLDAMVEERQATSGHQKGQATWKMALHRLMDLWPEQLAASYRPTVSLDTSPTAESNLSFLQDLYPSERGLHKVRAAGVVIETVTHMKHAAASSSAFSRTNNSNTHAQLAHLHAEHRHSHR